MLVQGLENPVQVQHHAVLLSDEIMSAHKCVVYLSSPTMCRGAVIIQQDFIQRSQEHFTCMFFQLPDHLNLFRWFFIRQKTTRELKMQKNITILIGILCVPIFSASAYTEPECTLPIDVVHNSTRSTTYCDPKTITAVAYYSGVHGWMVFGTNANVNKCVFKFKSGITAMDIDPLAVCHDGISSLSTYSTLENGVPYACRSDSDCDSANGWFCKNINSSYGVGICKQTGCGSNCQVGTGDWHNSVGYPAYQERTTVTCNSNTNTTYQNYYCSGTPEARCAPGYYGTNPKAAPYSGCDNQCPTWPDAYTTSALTTNVRGTSDAGATIISQCYILTNITYYDATGAFKLSSKCSYKN